MISIISYHIQAPSRGRSQAEASGWHQRQHDHKSIKEGLLDSRFELTSRLLITCHATRKINGDLERDEVDKEIFKFSKHKLRHQKSSDASVAVEDEKSGTLEILKINQFEFKFQSKSSFRSEIVAFIKSTPERISNNSYNNPRE